MTGDVGSWVHVAVVYSSVLQQVHYYRNGDHQGHQSFPQAAPVRATQLAILGLDGEISDVRVFNYRMNTPDVKTIHEGSFVAPLRAPEVPNGKVVCETWHDVDCGLLRRPLEQEMMRAADEVVVLSRRLFQLPGRDLGGTQLSRVRGFLYPPEDGDYRFLVQSSGDSMLCLQRYGAEEDTLAEILVKDSRWGPGQSSPVSLKSGRKYYFELLHLFDGRRGFGLRWEVPGTSIRGPISSEYFASYGNVD
jgi:hypothetical protein